MNLYSTYGSRHGRAEVTTAPAAEPLSTAEAKSLCRVETGVTADDTLIDTLVTAARRNVEKRTGLALIDQTVTQFLDAWPVAAGGAPAYLPDEGPLALLDAGPRGIAHVQLMGNPVQSVTSITTYDDADSGTVWASTNYQLSIQGSRARVSPRNGVAWPAAVRGMDAIKIIFVTGFGSAGSNVPEDIRRAIGLMVAHWYENREAASEGALQSIPVGVDALLEPYRIHRL